MIFTAQMPEVSTLILTLECPICSSRGNTGNSGNRGRNPIMSHLHCSSRAGLRIWAEAADAGASPAPPQTPCCQQGVRCECEAGLWPAFFHPPCLPATRTNHRSQPEPFPARATAGDPRAVHSNCRCCSVASPISPYFLE